MQSIVQISDKPRFEKFLILLAFVKGIFAFQKMLRETKFEKQLLPGMVVCNAKQGFTFKGVNVRNLLLSGGKWLTL
ncbi:MAG: hypothetical protein LBQ76_01935 [Candidatus Fibromonas sp.]|nr:hypothetical protein [Candidatus Fibromonas sp.]